MANPRKGNIPCAATGAIHTPSMSQLLKIAEWVGF